MITEERTEKSPRLYESLTQRKPISLMTVEYSLRKKQVARSDEVLNAPPRNTFNTLSPAPAPAPAPPAPPAPPTIYNNDNDNNDDNNDDDDNNNDDDDDDIYP